MKNPLGKLFLLIDDAPEVWIVSQGRIPCVIQARSPAYITENGARGIMVAFEAPEMFAHASLTAKPVRLTVLAPDDSTSALTALTAVTGTLLGYTLALGGSPSPRWRRYSPKYSFSSS